MKNIIFFSILLFTYSALSQCVDPISMTPPTVVNAACPGQGQITVTNVLPAQAGSDYYQYSLFHIATNSEVFTWQNSNIFPNLQAGSYEVRVRTRCTVTPYISAAIITSNVTVGDAEIVTSISSVNVLRNSKCINGVVSAVALGSGPLEYALVSTLTEMEPITSYVRPRQADNRFDSLAPGNYFMRVYNSCNNASTIPFTIGVDNSNTQIAHLSGYLIPIGCDSVSFGFRVSGFFKNIPNFPGDSQVKAWVKWPNASVDTINVGSQAVGALLNPLTQNYIARTSMANFDPAYNSSSVWPFSLSQSTYTIEMGFRDNCGVIHANTFTYTKANSIELVAEDVVGSSAVDCDRAAYRFYIRHISAGATTTAHGFRAQDGFQMSFDDGVTWTNSRTNNAYTTTTSNSYTDLRLFQRGVAHTVLIKYCDTTLSVTFTPEDLTILKADLAIDQSACLGYGRLRVRKYNANGSRIGVRVIAVPAGQAPIPYFEITLNSANEYYPTQFSNLLPGIYRVELLDTIGVSCQLRKFQAITVSAFNFDFNFSVNCNKNLEITSTKSLGNSVSNFRVKIFNSLNVQVFGGVDGIQGNTSSYVNIPGSSLASLPNGTYTIRVGRRLGNSTDNCSYVEKTWIKNDNNNLTLQNSIFISGCDNGLGALGASANGGSAPYVYTLTDLNDVEVLPSIPGGNTYEDLNTTGVYRLRVLDACGAVVNRFISSNSQFEIATPGYSTMPCVGSNINLSLPQFTGVSYAWMKDSVLIPSANSNIYSLNSLQLGDSGTYQSILTIGGCEVVGSLYINPLDCGGPLSVELTSFSANCDQNGSVYIGWETASEQNSLDFTVQKSTDLVSWQTVEIVSGKGNSNVNSKYVIVDRDPAAGTSYYRLIQRDYNGKETTYSPISSTCSQGGVSDLKVYPNPTNGDFKVECFSEKRSTIQLEIVDLNGRLIDASFHQLQPGNNILFISEDLSKGVYIIKIAIDKEEQNPTKLVVN